LFVTANGKIYANFREKPRWMEIADDRLIALLVGG
jgi:hypothetical protein